MKEYQFTTHLYITASSKKQAKERLQIALDNLREMTGHSPFGCELVLANDDCSVWHTEEDDD